MVLPRGQFVVPVLAAAAAALVRLLAGCESGSVHAGSGIRIGADAGNELRIDAGAEEADAEVTKGPSFPHDFTDAAIAAVTHPGSLTDASCDAGPTEAGIGQTCTRLGGQCPRGLVCTADFMGESGICTILGCGGTAGACGAGGSCCTLLEVGGVSLCLPNACLPDSCLEGY